MPEIQPPNDAMIGWLEQMQSRLEKLLEPNSALATQHTFQELLDLSQHFLAMSRRLLELGMTASKAAEQMLKRDG